MLPMDAFADLQITPAASLSSSAAAPQSSAEEIKKQELRTKIQQTLSFSRYNLEPIQLSQVKLKEFVISELNTLGWKVIESSPFGGSLILFPSQPKEVATPTGWGVEHTAFEVYKRVMIAVQNVVVETVKVVHDHPENGCGVLYLPSIPTNVLTMLQQKIVESGRECHHTILSLGERQNRKIVHQLYVVNGEGNCMESWSHGAELAFVDQ